MVSFQTDKIFTIGCKPHCKRSNLSGFRTRSTETAKDLATIVTTDILAKEAIDMTAVEKHNLRRPISTKAVSKIDGNVVFSQEYSDGSLESMD